MGLLDMFRKKKHKEESIIESGKIVTDLEQLCGNDKETYEALAKTMSLDPRKIGISMKDAAETGKKAEKEKDIVRARVNYRIAGSLAIYEGNVKKAVEFFAECEKLSLNEEFLFLKNPEKAVTKAQEYYQKHLK